MTVGNDIRLKALRDTTNYYLQAPESLFLTTLIEFATRYCGKHILDLGCATGNYMAEFTRRGYDCVGVDVNPAYIERAKKRGLNVHLVTDKLPFPDKSFDTVVMFEVAEHLPDIVSVLAEARRVARKNIILSVPNCEEFDGLQQSGLIYEHFLDKDHKNFFTPVSMAGVLSKLFGHVEIHPGDPVLATVLVDNRVVRLILRGLYKLRIIKPKYFFRLYVVIHLIEPA